MQDVAYTYNERGWLLGSSAPLFAMALQYNTGTNKAYNGNIQYQNWGTPGSLANSYTYTYDKLNRLLSGSSTASNNESGIAYDLMGNITALNRYTASTLADQLSYSYTGNQLTGITDATSSDVGLKHGTWAYTYDGNGNLITDPSKGASGISMAYNLLNLPQSITGSKTITYTYDAAGNKLRRVSPATGNTDYINGIQYDAGALSFIQTEEGRALVDGSTYNYEYNLGDNLGNVRVTFDSSTGKARQVQKDDYYPFGMEISTSFNSPKNEYLYNKKELQEELGTYDYGARFYDPVKVRWDVVDPLSEKSRRFSPYNYVENNPIRNIDLDGMECSPCDLHGGHGVITSKQTDSSPIPGGDPEVVANVLGVGGTVIEGIGWTAALTGQEYGDFLIPIGANLSAAGTLISSGNDAINGKYGSALLKLGTTFTFSAVESKLDALQEAGKLSKTGKNILGLTNFAASKMGDKMVEKGTEKKEAITKANEANAKFVKKFFKDQDLKKQIQITKQAKESINKDSPGHEHLKQ